MKTAIVILNWNGKKLLEKFLPTVIKFSPEASIYVADNASTDNSVEFIKTTYPDISVIQNKTNGGYAQGYNEALKHVEADVFCLLNSDVEVTENWLKPVMEIFRKHPEAAIVQPKILDYKKKEYFEYAGAAGGFIDSFGYPYCRGRIFNTLEKDNGQYNDITEIFWASGACFFIKSEAYNTLKGLDEDYFAHQEEIDLCWRAQNQGYKVYYTGMSHVYHVGGATLSNVNPKKTFLNFRNSLFSLLKNLPSQKLFPVIITRLFLDAIAGVRFLSQFKPLHILSIIRAHLSFYYYFVKTFKKRTKNLKNEKYYDTKSVVWSYFIANKKYYDNFKKD
ncbi:glycosyltransferase family 2 protein [Abyssalbus ytuae]|uniref:Glycosyltransferase family 2 protein n=1 Tax=Abyssalbus ytuae TaxID=2926907 RepID=A0A9E7CZ85_9FLAO|nr:glycosyltransferase family 2 protein [Abyssalbus ytuae]UOB17335.1 glycosyltransferase family 2 protein [Abyssalbus ytuae]